MPPIVIGAGEQPVTILTPQDKRVDSQDEKGWWTPGHWPVDLLQEGPYTIHVRLTEIAPEKTTVRLAFEGDGKTWEEELSIPRGVGTAAVGEVTFPTTGRGRFTARVEGDGGELHVHQVTIR